MGETQEPLSEVSGAGPLPLPPEEAGHALPDLGVQEADQRRGQQQVPGPQHVLGLDIQ